MAVRQKMLANHTRRRCSRFFFIIIIVFFPMYATFLPVNFSNNFLDFSLCMYLPTQLNFFFAHRSLFVHFFFIISFLAVATLIDFFLLLLFHYCFFLSFLA